PLDKHVAVKFTVRRHVLLYVFCGFSLYLLLVNLKTRYWALSDLLVLFLHSQVNMNHLKGCSLNYSSGLGKNGFIVIQAEQPDFKYLILA
ncbi:unnamed protein product, partial [Bubo scandiacus]